MENTTTTFNYLDFITNDTTPKKGDIIIRFEKGDFVFISNDFGYLTGIRITN